MTMAVAEQRRPIDVPAHLRVEVAPSFAVELHWVTMTDLDGSMRVRHPALADLAADTELVGELRTFWWDVGALGDSCTAHSLPEILVLADRAGVLGSTDVDAVLEGMATAAAVAAPEPALASEDDDERALILRRLAVLAADPDRRRAWLRMVAAAAAVVRHHWERTGVDMTRRAARARASQLPWTDPADAIRGWAGRDYDGKLPDLLFDASRRPQPVLVTPTYWSGDGLLFDLEHHLLVGIPTQLGAAGARARTEPWVRELKALADPTRLAILDHLGSAPRTISEVAGDFGLAQPTVSRHVRLLRDAGLVIEARHGSTVTVRADLDRLAQLIEGLDSTLVRRPVAAAPPPGVPAPPPGVPAPPLVA
jgi:DNA-binding transcriptional ArsR family regulator